MHAVARGGFLVLAVLLAVAAPAWAGSAASTLAVGASVVSNCIVTTTAAAFGAYDPIGANKTAPLDSSNGKVTLTCTQGSAARIGLAAGLNAAHATATSRALVDSSGTRFLNYDLYADSSRTTVWTNTSGGSVTPGAAPSRAPRDFTVYGRVSANQDAPAGTYSDTVLVGVDF